MLCIEIGKRKENPLNELGGWVNVDVGAFMGWAWGMAC